MDRKAKAWMVLVLFLSGVLAGPGAEGARDVHDAGLKEAEAIKGGAGGGSYFYNPQGLWGFGDDGSWLHWLPLGGWGMFGHKHMGFDLGHRGHFGDFGHFGAAATDKTHEMATAAAATDKTHEMATAAAKQAP